MAFDWLERQTQLHGDVLPRDLLLAGFQFEGRRVPFVSAQGIFKPAVCPEIPLTITTSPNGPYEDSFADEHKLLYRYRGTDPRHRDNVGLREAMRRRTPLIYLFGLIPGRYLPIWPVFIVSVKDYRRKTIPPSRPGEGRSSIVAGIRSQADGDR